MVGLKATDRRELPPTRRPWDFMWCPPWVTTRPWLPRCFQGSDEYHNYSWAVILPFLGCFILFRKRYPTVEGTEHVWAWNKVDGWSGLYVVGCPMCAEIYSERPDDPVDGLPHRLGSA